MKAGYAVRFHPAVRADLLAIAGMLAERAGRAAAERALADIEATVRGLGDLPHRGSLRPEITEGLRAIPAGRRAVVAFAVGDATREVLVYAVTWGGADWMARVGVRR